MNDDRPLNPADQIMLNWFEAMNESTRGFVICCVAMIDDELRRLIQSMMPQSDENRRKAAEEIFDPVRSGSLQSIHSKSQLSYAMGWIDSETYNDIRQLSRIRNIFAHEREAPTFDDPRVQKIVRKLLLPRRVYDEADLTDLSRTDHFMMIGHMDSDVSFDTKGKPLAQTVFFSSVSFIIGDLESRPGVTDSID